MASKSNMRKFIAGSVTAAVVASAIAPAVSADVKSFSDIQEGHWAYTEIMALAQDGIINGYPDGTFRSSVILNRGQAANLLTAALDLDIPSDLDAFKDVSAQSVFAEAAAATKAAGIFGGKANGTIFGAGDELTREQMASVLVRAFDLEDTGEEVTFTDWNKISESHKENVKILAQHGVTTGKADGSFDPKGNVSRGHFATFLFRAMNIEAAEITAISPVADITVKEGEKVELPSVVEVTYSDDSKKDVAVVWNETDFTAPGEYVVEGTVEGTDLKASVKVTVEQAPFQVKSVESVNAKQVTVNFSRAVDVDSVLEDAETGELVEGVVTIDSVGDAAAVTAITGELSEDGKTLTLTAGEGEIFDGRYSVTVVGAEDTEGNEIESFASFFTADDTTRPTVSGVTYTSANTAKISFSEPVSEWGTITLNGADANVVDTGSDYVLVDLSSLDYEEKATVTFVGVEDFAGNFVSPNPVNVNVERPAEDVTAPKVESISVVSDTRVKVVFSEELESATFEVNDTPVASDAITKDEDTVTYYLNVDLVDGVNKVEVTAFEDIAGNAGEAVSRQFVVSVDDVAPEVTGSKVLTNEDGQEYLQLTFSEAVELGTEGELTFTGTLQENYVTKDDQEFTATPVVDEDDNTKVNIPLQDADKGEWTIDLPEGFVADLAQAGNDSEATEVKFVRGEDAVEEAEVTVSAAEDANVVTLTFNGKLDGASAVNKANYAVEGAKVATAKLTSNTDSSATVVLTLEEGSVKANGAYQLTVDGVKAANGSLVEADTFEVELTENVAPSLEAATLVNGTDVELTFSEAIDADTISGEDFSVLVDGEAVAVSEVVTGTGKEFVLTLGTALTSEQLAEAITLELTETTDVADVNGNELKAFESLTVAKDIQ